MVASLGPAAPKSIFAAEASVDAPAACADHARHDTFVNTAPTRGEVNDTAAFVRAYALAHPLPSGAKRAAQWTFAHAGAVQAARAALTGVGAVAYAVGSLSVAPWAWVVNAVGLGLASGRERATASKAGLATACIMGGVMPVAINTVLGGAVAGLVTGVGGGIGAVLLGGALFERLLAKPGYDTASYPYQDKRYAGSRLYHLPDERGGRAVPILELNAKDAFGAGFAHGYLLGPQMDTMLTSFRHDLLATPDFGRKYKSAIAKLREMLLPEEAAELQGLKLGFNTWAMEAGSKQRLTFGDVLAVQLQPDSMHFQWERANAAPRAAGARRVMFKTPVAGCTSIMLRNVDGSLTWGRNMDWPAFGMGGAMSLPIVWKHHETGNAVAVLGVPGLIGAVSGWNDRGLTLAMNVVGGKTASVGGVPAALYNRRLLREASSVSDVMRNVARGDVAPLGPYHLLVGDARDARCISFYQNPDKSHHVRSLDKEPLWCLNWSYPGHRWDVFTSEARQAALEDYFRAAAPLGPLSADDQATLVEGALQLGSTNNLITLHTLVFNGERVSMRWGNAFAASQTPVEIARDAVFAD